MHMLFEYLDSISADWNAESDDIYMVKLTETVTYDILNEYVGYKYQIVNCGDCVVISERGIDVDHVLYKNGYSINEMVSVDQPPMLIEAEARENGTTNEEIFKKFGQAMKVLGQQLGIGPLQDKLKSQGITWKQTPDFGAIVFYIKNDGGKKQPIAKISANSLSTQNEFQIQLLNILDFARGNAPGTFKQRKDEISRQEGVVRDISKSVWPTDSGSQIAQIMMTK